MANHNDLVSIIVPVYGTEDYLPACIESICNQSYPNIQIILVDDQSPDRCPDICDAYAQKDSRIMVIHQKNAGVSGARNAGIRYATGAYLMFVDSDDVLYPNAVQIMLDDAHNESADIVSALKKTPDQPGKNVGAIEDGELSVYRQEIPLLRYLCGDISSHSACAKLFKASFIEGIFFEEGKNINEDGFFVFQCYLRKPTLVQHDLYVYQYNIRPGSGSREAFSDKYLSMLYFCDRKKELIATYYPQYSAQIHNVEVRTNLQMLDLLCRTTDRKYIPLQKQCIRTVRRLYIYHNPINRHHRLLAWIAASGLYPLYKWAVRMKYYR